MHLELNFKSGKPAYLQIMDQIKYAAAMRALRPGDQLPSIRDLAERLRINRNTVAKAYSELEHEGVVEMVQGKGVFITGNSSPLLKSARNALLTETIDAAIVQAHHFQIEGEEFIEFARERLAAFEKRKRQASERE